MTAPFDLRAAQTTDHPLFRPRPRLSTGVVLSSAVSGIKRHRPHPPKALLLLRFVWCSILGKSTCKTIMDNDSDPPSDLKPSLAPLPPSFMCPIGHEIMCDPVSCADGHSYERAHIKCWLVSNSTSPLTGAVLPTKVVTSNQCSSLTIIGVTQMV